MFHFHRVDPCPELRDYIKGYWLIRKELLSCHSPLRLVPDGYPELMFHLDTSFYLKRGENDTLLPPSCLLGQATGTLEVNAEQGARAFFVKMYPWVPYLLFGIPQKEFVDQSFDLELLTNSPKLRLLSRLIRSASSFEKAVQIIEDFLIREVQLQEKKHPVLSFACRRIIASKGRISMEDLGKGIKLSHRYLEQLFQKGLGLSPKRYARIIRNKEISCRMANTPPDNLGAFAQDMGYFDQAHFIKDFKSITGQTPTQYLQYMEHFPIREMDQYLDQFQ